MDNPLVTYGFNKDREGIEQLGSAQSSGNKWKFHKFLLVKNYLKESLLPIFCLIIPLNRSKGFLSKGFDAEHRWEIYLVAFLTWSVI